ncbi:MAG: GNAT family N-acetyltransferase [bacterium]|nr:GNAT family N-acetyltransferase [bacterium]
MGSIYPITPEMLRPEVLHSLIYPDLDQVLFWDDTWDPEFYVALAHAGFICIAHEDPEIGPLLIPELQDSYAVLDWQNLHRSRNLRRLLRSQRLTEEGVELRVVASAERVLENLAAYHDRTWILQRYRELVGKLPRNSAPGFAIHGIELWSQKRNELVAGEFGYTIGRTYTSLSGFCSPDDREYRHFGTLQMYLLAEMLRDCGYAFWNMGHPSPEYKAAFGARILPRLEFLEKWFEARDIAPKLELAEAQDQRFPETENRR